MTVMTVVTVVTAGYLRHIIIYMAKRAVQAQWLAQLDRPRDIGLLL